MVVSAKQYKLAVIETILALVLFPQVANSSPASHPALPVIHYLLLSDQVENLSPPANLFNIGDSIGVGQAANNNIFALSLPEHVWSTGYDPGDLVNSLNERFQALDGLAYHENSAADNVVFNQAFSGGVMADFAAQALDVASQSSVLPDEEAGMVAVLLGSNDVCTEAVDEPMIDTTVFETQLRAGLDVLGSAASTENAVIHVSGIPAIYWLWEARKDTLLCPAVWSFVPCQNLLASIDESIPEDDCESDISSQTPDLIFDGDGPNCRHRKAFHAQIRDEFNPILESVVAEYQGNGQLPNANFIDIFDVKFETEHVNSGDCFHPSIAGHALLARKHWCRSVWGAADPACTGE